nr:peptidylprolyl isomerase [Campylobacterota bacterium]
ASSYGKKYALGNLFLIDDTQDADATNNHGKKAIQQAMSSAQLKSAKDYVKSGGKVKDADLKDFYKKNTSMFKKPETAKAKHILLANEADAKAVIKDLKGAKNINKKFVELAKAKSTGPSGPSGGDLGWFDKKRMVKEFSDAAFALKKGSYTKKPVKTQFGYHVILLEDKKPAGNVSFEEAKPSIEQSLKVQKFQEKMKAVSKKLKEKADISIK